MNKLTPEEIEEAALKAQANFGAAEIMVFVDPATGETFRIDVNKLTKEQLELLYKASSK